MKRKHLVIGAVIGMFISQSTFAWWSGPRWFRVDRGGWTVLRSPITRLPMPIFVPYEPGSKYESRSHEAIRSPRGYEGDSFGNSLKKTVRIRRPKR